MPQQQVAPVPAQGGPTEPTRPPSRGRPGRWRRSISTFWRSLGGKVVVAVGLVGLGSFAWNAREHSDRVGFVIEHSWELLTGFVIALIAVVLARKDADAIADSTKHIEDTTRHIAETARDVEQNMRHTAEIAHHIAATTSVLDRKVGRVLDKVTRALATHPVHSFPGVLDDIIELVRYARRKQASFAEGARTGAESRTVELLVLCDHAAYGFWSGHEKSLDYLNELRGFNDEHGVTHICSASANASESSARKQFERDFPGGRLRRELAFERREQAIRRSYPGERAPEHLDDFARWLIALADRRISDTCSFLPDHRLRTDENIPLFIWAVRSVPSPRAAMDPEAPALAPRAYSDQKYHRAIFVVSDVSDRAREPGFITTDRALVRTLCKVVEQYYT